MVPAVALRSEDQLTGGFHVAVKRLAGIDIIFALLAQEHLLLAGFWIDESKLFRFIAALVVIVADCFPIWRPVKPGRILEWKFEGRRFHINAFFRSQIKDDRLRFR